MTAFLGFGTRVVGLDSPLSSERRASRGETDQKLSESGADPFVADGNEAPLKKLFWLNGLSAISFWVVVSLILNNPGLVPQPILKFIGYLSMLLWINSVFYLKNIAEERETESSEFQREQVKLSLFVLGILFVGELPLMLSVL